MKERRRWIFVLATALLFASGTAAWATSAEEIMAEIDAKQTTETAVMRMVMRIHPILGSDTNVRGFRIESYSRGTEESQMVFVAPQSIRGLRVLEVGDDTRVYFPSTGRIRRITGDQQSGSVGGVGGDFSYEDMGSGTYTDDYDLSIEREDSSRWVIRGVPTDPDSSYTHVFFYVEKSTVQVVRTEYFTKDEGHEKTLFLENYTAVQELEIATHLRMVNHAKDQETIVEIVGFRVNVPIDSKQFNPNRFYR